MKNKHIDRLYEIFYKAILNKEILVLVYDDKKSLKLDYKRFLEFLKRLNNIPYIKYKCRINFPKHGDLFFNTTSDVGKIQGIEIDGYINYSRNEKIEEFLKTQIRNINEK